MRSPIQTWMVVGLLLATTAYAIAEEMTLTTYYPSPRGVYRELRVGSGNAPSPTAMLQVIGDGSSALFRADDVMITAASNLGVGITGPSERLHVVGNGIVTGNLNLGGNAAIGGDAAIAGNATVGGNITVTGTVNANAINTVTIAITGGSPGPGKVLSSDATGNGTWDYPKYAP